MKALIVAGVLLHLALVVAAKPSLNEWNEFKKQHGKEYADQEEDNMRMSIFLKNKKMVEEFNRDESHKRGFKMAINHLSDWTEAELQHMNGYKAPQDYHTLRNNSLAAEDFLNQIITNPDPVPDEIDWRTVPNRVTSVKNQGHCGSCWAFSTTGLLEGQQIVQGKDALDILSEQNLVDCSAYYSDGCSGGYPYFALFFIGNQGGLNDESTYPYKGHNNPCTFNNKKVVFNDAGAAGLNVGDENQLKEIVAKYGPVSVSIHVTKDMFHYKSGIYKSTTCRNTPDQLNHSVLVVGYGTDPTAGYYWIVKNSWGSGWGDKGYIKMARNNNNMCGITTDAVIAIFD